MKKIFSLTAAALTLLLCLTACTGNRNTVNPATGTTSMTEDRHYTADSSGRTNEAGDDGRTTGSNSTATNGVTSDRTGNGTMNNGTTTSDRTTDGTMNNGTITYRRTDERSTVADGVRGAVNEAGEVVDDVADGAADIVDRVTDTVQDDDTPNRRTQRP